MTKLKHLWESNKVTLATKTRIFDACIRSVFMYNAELWTLNKKSEKQINAFHRKLLRKMLNIRWPTNISNEKLQQKTKQKPWTNFIAEQRLHAIRLPGSSAAKKALEESERRVNRPQGRPQNTWLSCTKKLLSDINITWDEAQTLATDRKKWRTIINDFKKS